MTVLKTYSSFILGKCRCGCNKDIPIRSSYQTLKRFKHGHNLRNFKHKKKITHKGLDSHSWKTGRTKDRRKYWRILVHDYYKSDKNGRMMEHIYFYEQYHKCCVLPWVDVHHKDGNKDNNMPWNLMTIEHNLHGKLHNPKGKPNKKKDMSDRICCICGSHKTYVNKKGHHIWRRLNGKWCCRKCFRRITHT